MNSHPVVDQFIEHALQNLQIEWYDYQSLKPLDDKCIIVYDRNKIKYNFSSDRYEMIPSQKRWFIENKIEYEEFEIVVIFKTIKNYSQTPWRTIVLRFENIEDMVAYKLGLT